MTTDKGITTDKCIEQFTLSVPQGTSSIAAGIAVMGGTNPLLYDTDRDGLWDGYELQLTGSIGEQLTETNKAKYKTNPVKADTDGDGLLDGDSLGAIKELLDPETLSIVNMWKQTGLMYKEYINGEGKQRIDFYGENNYQTDPTNKDLFVEVDYIEGFAPYQTTLDYFVSYYAKLGITVHIETWQQLTKTEILANTDDNVISNSADIDVLEGATTEQGSAGEYITELAELRNAFHDHKETHLYVLFANKISRYGTIHIGISDDSFGAVVAKGWVCSQTDTALAQVDGLIKNFWLELYNIVSPIDITITLPFTDTEYRGNVERKYLLHEVGHCLHIGELDDYDVDADKKVDEVYCGGSTDLTPPTPIQIKVGTIAVDYDLLGAISDLTGWLEVNIYYEDIKFPTDEWCIMSRPSDLDNPDYNIVAAVFSIREPVYCDECLRSLKLGSDVWSIDP
jgi:hypothetical protein